MFKENMLQIFKNCSKESKEAIGQFINHLFPIQLKNNSDIQNSSELQQLFIQITSTFSLEKSRQLSKNERNLKQLSSYQYNYGEITFKSISLLLSKILSYRPTTDNQIFYDLGSGAGKVIFAASLCYPFKKCIGIEVLESLHQFSLGLKRTIQKNIKSIEERLSIEYNSNYKLPEVEMINKDFKDYDWSDGTVIFVSSTCYSHQLMKELAKLSQKMKIGSIFVTLTRKLQEQSKFWKVLESVKGWASWGSTTVFIQIKQL